MSKLGNVWKGYIIFNVLTVHFHSTCINHHERSGWIWSLNSAFLYQTLSASNNISQGKSPHGKLVLSRCSLFWFCEKNGLLVGGFNPIEKYARQFGSFPQVGVKIKNISNHHLACDFCWWENGPKIRRQGTDAKNPSMNYMESSFPKSSFLGDAFEKVKTSLASKT